MAAAASCPGTGSCRAARRVAVHTVDSTLGVGAGDEPARSTADGPARLVRGADARRPCPESATAPAAWAPTGLSPSGTVPAPRAGGEPAAPAFAASSAGRPDHVGFGTTHDEDDDFDDDDDYDERPRHPYTWLHLIVLALVAFVLGFLIVLLLSNNSADDAGSTAAAHLVIGPPADPAGL